MTSSWFDFSSTSKTLNFSFLQFNEWSGSENHEENMEAWPEKIVSFSFYPIFIKFLTYTDLVPKERNLEITLEIFNLIYIYIYTIIIGIDYFLSYIFVIYKHILLLKL